MLSLSLDTSEKCAKQLYSCAISSDRVIAAGCSDGSTTVLKPDGKIVLNHHKYPVTAVCFANDYLITASSDHRIVFWNVRTGQLTEKVMLHTGPVRCLCVSKDGSLLISGSSDQTVGITNILTKPTVLRHLKQNESDSGMLSGICIGHDNSFIVSVATSGTVFLYDINTAKPRSCVYDAHEMGVNGCDITMFKGGHLLCTVGADYKVKFWAVDNKAYTLKYTRTLSGHTGQVLCTKFHVISTNIDTLFTGSVDKSVIIWDVETGNKLHQSICHTAFVYALALVDDKLVTCSADKSIKCWTVHYGKVRTVNVLPLAHQDKLEDWSNKQVQSWLTRLLPDTTTTLTGEELLLTDLDTLLNTISHGGSTETVRTKLKRSITLLRCFDGVPAEFLCPISMEIMTDPVVTTDGHSYERANITEWLSAGHNTSPFTNTTLSTNSIVTNHNLRKVIETVFFMD